MKFHKLEILEIKMDNNIYYGIINGTSAILSTEKNIPDELDLKGETIIKNENYYKIKINNKILTDSIIDLYYPASIEMIESYKNKIKIITETYDEYKSKIEPYINSILDSNTKWIKNILFYNTEAERLIFKGEDFVVIKNIGWDTNKLNDFYILAIPFENIKNIRHLNLGHKDLLKLMKLKTLEIAKKYGYEEEDLYFFFHYHPSCYHLHLHVCVNNHKILKFRIYRHILLDYILDKIETIGKNTLKFEINISNPIYKLLKV